MASKCDEEKNSFTNQVVKVKIVFPLFLVKSKARNASGDFCGPNYMMNQMNHCEGFQLLL